MEDFESVSPKPHGIVWHAFDKIKKISSSSCVWLSLFSQAIAVSKIVVWQSFEDVRRISLSGFVWLPLFSQLMVSAFRWRGSEDLFLASSPPTSIESKRSHNGWYSSFVESDIVWHCTLILLTLWSSLELLAASVVSHITSSTVWHSFDSVWLAGRVWHPLLSSVGLFPFPALIVSKEKVWQCLDVAKRSSRSRTVWHSFVSKETIRDVSFSRAATSPISVKGSMSHWAGDETSTTLDDVWISLSETPALWYDVHPWGACAPPVINRRLFWDVWHPLLSKEISSTALLPIILALLWRSSNCAKSSLVGLVWHSFDDVEICPYPEIVWDSLSVYRHSSGSLSWISNESTGPPHLTQQMVGNSVWHSILWFCNVPLRLGKSLTLFVWHPVSVTPFKKEVWLSLDSYFRKLSCRISTWHCLSRPCTAE